MISLLAFSLVFALTMGGGLVWFVRRGRRVQVTAPVISRVRTVSPHRVPGRVPRRGF